MEKSEQPEAWKCEDGVDFISNMPDAILVLILSRIPSTKEAIRSSILSRRWRYLWIALPSLYLDIRRFGYKQREFEEFTNWVLVNKSVDLDRFRLHCSNYYSMSTVWRWIHDAVARKVKKLDLWFYPKNYDREVEMPHFLVTCGSLVDLELNTSRSCLRLPNINIMGFSALRVLMLSEVELLEEDALVTNFLESCPLLEELTLIDCLLFNLDFLCISCLKLKKLFIVIVDEYVDGMCGALKVFCPKLVDLYLTGYIAYNYFFESLDSLKEAWIKIKVEGDTKSVLFPGISHVESLLIDLNLLL